MSTAVRPDGFGAAGLGALSDLATPDWQRLFAALEADQRAFHDEARAAYTKRYPWPIDALHWWSRVWEYPFAFHHLAAFRSALGGDTTTPVVVDLGCGITFFPFSVARLGYRVICVDADPVCVDGVERAAAMVRTDPGSVSSAGVSGGRLPLADASADAVYCISVLEHVADRDAMLREIRRVLRPGGLLVLTIDLDMTGKAQMGAAAFQELSLALSDGFAALVHERTIHPADILYSNQGPCPYVEPPMTLARLWYDVKQCVKPLLGRKPQFVPRTHLAVCGMVLSRTR